MTALDTLGWVLVHAVWQATVVTGLHALFLRVGQASARVRYASGFGALLLLVASSAVTALVLAAAGVHASSEATNLRMEGPTLNVVAPRATLIRQGKELRVIPRS